MKFRKKHFFRIVSITLFFFYTGISLNAQYFGKNKVKYRPFDFKVKSSENIELYYYIQDDSLVNSILESAEIWRARHHKIFTDSLGNKIPLILYKHHGDFQQTGVVGGLIGTTTGGVTEGLRNRVTMPLTYSYAQTRHVLGHELVHAHQYNMMMIRDSLSLKNMANIPLWMTEGLAEYMSIGNRDAHTAMWLRDALLHDYFPEIKDLSRPKYFPYRWGQAFWAFVGGTFGEDKIFDLYLETAKIGVSDALKKVLGMPADSLSKRWKAAAVQQYDSLMRLKRKNPDGSPLVNDQNGGRLNISPSVSPDGKYFIFLSEKNIFSLDLYLAEVKTGKIIRKLSKNSRLTHIDALDLFESSGSWSPDGSKFCFTGYAHGKNKMYLASLPKGKIDEEFFVEGVPSFQNPSWSPDGKYILISGLVQGKSDLYLVDIKTHQPKPLTHDLFAQIQPTWSPDGRYIAFATDKRSDEQNFPSLKMSIALYDTQTKKIEYLPLFPDADNLNPQFLPDGKSLLFLSDYDGFRNIYQYDFADGKIYRLTNLATGVSGITKYATAISMSKKKNDLLYCVYENSNYVINRISLDWLKPEEVDPTNEVKETADILPSLHLHSSDITRRLYEKPDDYIAAVDTVVEQAYEPKFKLDYISSGGIGIATGRYGTGMAGGINMLFGDVMNDNQVYVGAMLNGELQDFGGQAAYLNRKHRYSWGGSMMHYPYRYMTYEINPDVVTVNGDSLNVIRQTYNLYRIFKKQVSAFSYYPFSKFMRVEGSVSYNYYSFRLDKYHYYYTMNYPYYYLGEARERNLYAGDSFGFMDFSLAWVGDSSGFGMTAPMNGYRYRMEVQQSIGRLNMTAILTDLRAYKYVKPVSFAVRGYHYSRHGESASDGLLPPLFLGYETLVRGYTYKAFSRSLSVDPESLNYTDLIGNKMIVTNAEIRLPFTGPKRLAVMKSGFLFTDLNLFYDAGLIWGDYGDGENGISRDFQQAQFISSTGISLRVNVFGQLIVEPYFAFPLQLKEGGRGVFGLNFTPGW